MRMSGRVTTDTKPLPAHKGLVSKPHRELTRTVFVIDTLGLPDSWEDSGPAIEIKRCLETYK